MLGITHFTVGVTGELLLNQKLNYDRLSVPFLSGVFPMLADLDQISTCYITQNINDTILNNIFWFHGFIDPIETNQPEIGGFTALLLLIFVAVYFRTNHLNLKSLQKIHSRKNIEQPQNSINNFKTRVEHSLTILPVYWMNDDT
jgi:hypothetical protein